MLKGGPKGRFVTVGTISRLTHLTKRLPKPVLRAASRTIITATASAIGAALERDANQGDRTKTSKTRTMRPCCMQPEPRMQDDEDDFCSPIYPGD